MVSTETGLGSTVKRSDSSSVCTKEVAGLDIPRMGIIVKGSGLIVPLGWSIEEWQAKGCALSSVPEWLVSAVDEFHTEDFDNVKVIHLFGFETEYVLSTYASLRTVLAKASPLVTFSS